MKRICIGILISIIYLFRASVLAENIDRDSRAEYFPGFTLVEYIEDTTNQTAQAGYYRIDDGKMIIKQAMFTAQGDCVSEMDTMPVPLTAEFLNRLETENAENLICACGDYETFLVDDAIATEKISIEDTVLKADLQRDGMVVLAEDREKKRRIYWVTMTSEGDYEVASTNVLPMDVSLDFFHAGNDEISIRWNGTRRAGYRYCADGSWMLEWVMSGFDYQAVYWGIQVYSEYASRGNPIKVGTLQAFDMFEADLERIPSTEEELVRDIDQSGWAVVSCPDSKGRLHLKREPMGSAESLGEFYNGTPVRVSECTGDWCRVSIGLNDELEGYMLTTFLAFDKDMDSVEWTFPQKQLNEDGIHMYTDIERIRVTDTIRDIAYWIVGTTQDQCYIVLTENGAIGYIPQDWFEADNSSCVEEEKR